ncbi:hypothetical protein SNEBB_000373 [Seison nebaliae]|nr:hypothetical protein SNEBB_000373 [Seison nebaliae]
MKILTIWILVINIIISVFALNEPCRRNRCFNGRCTNNKCLCDKDYGGELCDQLVTVPPPCPITPCQSTSTCVDGICQCNPGFTGLICDEIPNLVCGGSVCVQASDCMPSAGTSVCKCHGGFTGRHCDQLGMAPHTLKYSSLIILTSILVAFHYL